MTSWKSPRPSCYDLRLNSELRNLIGTDGKEIDPHSSSYVFHQLGCFTKNLSPCKTSLKLSANFFNAAIIRQPENSTFGKDLEDLCSHVLEVSGAKSSSADLLSISHTVSTKVQDLRQFTNGQLEKLKSMSTGISVENSGNSENWRIRFVKQLQAKISKKYTNLMDFISNKCIEILGKPPCKYCLVGLGSLARCEVTPYSSFDHLILLEEQVNGTEDYKNILEYFEWYSVMFHIILTNLKETPLLKLWFYGYSNLVDEYTKQGISFDATMQDSKYDVSNRKISKVHFRRFQYHSIPVAESNSFIGPISDCKYSNDINSSDESLRFSWDDAFTAVAYPSLCYVSGCKGIFDCFLKVIKKQLLLDKHEIRKIPKCKQDLLAYCVFRNIEDLKHASCCDIKRTMYFSLVLFVSALGHMFSIDETDSFSIIEKLRRKNILDYDKAHKLLFCVSLACEVRLKTCVFKNAYCKPFSGIWGNGSALKYLNDLVGTKNLFNFFTTVHWLQSIFHVSVTEGDFISTVQNYLKKEVPEEYKFAILKLLNLETIFLCKMKTFSENFPSKHLLMQCELAEMYVNLKRHSEALGMFDTLIKSTKDKLVVAKSTAGRILCHFGLNNYEEVVKLVEQEVPELIFQFQSSQITIFDVRSLENKPNYNCLNFLLPCEKNITLAQIAFAYGHSKRLLYNIDSRNATLLQSYEEAMIGFQQCINFCYEHKLGIYCFVARPKHFICLLCRSSFYIGLCQFALQQFSDAIKSINQVFVIADDRDFVNPTLLFDCYALLEKCYAQLNRPARALSCLTKQANIILQYGLFPSESSGEVLKDFKKLLNLYVLSQKMFFSKFCNDDFFNYVPWPLKLLLIAAEGTLRIGHDWLPKSSLAFSVKSLRQTQYRAVC